MALELLFLLSPGKKLICNYTYCWKQPSDQGPFPEHMRSGVSPQTALLLTMAVPVSRAKQVTSLDQDIQYTLAWLGSPNELWLLSHCPTKAGKLIHSPTYYWVEYSVLTTQPWSSFYRLTRAGNQPAILSSCSQPMAHPASPTSELKQLPHPKTYPDSKGSIFAIRIPSVQRYYQQTRPETQTELSLPKWTCEVWNRRPLIPVCRYQGSWETR